MITSICKLETNEKAIIQSRFCVMKNLCPRLKISEYLVVIKPYTLSSDASLYFQILFLFFFFNMH